VGKQRRGNHRQAAARGITSSRPLPTNHTVYGLLSLQLGTLGSLITGFAAPRGKTCRYYEVNYFRDGSGVKMG